MNYKKILSAVSAAAICLTSVSLANLNFELVFEGTIASAEDTVTENLTTESTTEQTTETKDSSDSRPDFSVKFTIGTVTVSPGSTTATVPVTVSDNDGFAGTGILYSYDEKLTISSATSGELITNTDWYKANKDLYKPSCARGAGGKAAVATAYRQDVTGEGVFYYLNFALPTDTKDGDVFEITGEAKGVTNASGYDLKREVVSGKIIVSDSSGNPTDSTETNPTGYTKIVVMNNHVFHVTEIYNLEIALTESDVNEDGEVDSKDAVEVLVDYANRLAGGTSSFKGKGTYGNANADDKIDSKDAVLILRYYANKLAN